MPDNFNFTPEQLRSMSQSELNELYFKIFKTNPRPGTPLYILADYVDTLADLAWARDFAAGAVDYTAGIAKLQSLASAADSALQKLDNAAEILQGITKVVGYLQKGVELAAKAASLFAMAAPGSRARTVVQNNSINGGTDANGGLTPCLREQRAQ